MALFTEVTTITEATTISIGLLLAVGGFVAAWATLREQVKTHSGSHKDHRRALDDHGSRISSLERWRERQRGAEEATKGTSMLDTSDKVSR